ncbi:hypothetical protein OG203_15870 [Nocardia sp. NBC_01499]
MTDTITRDGFDRRAHFGYAGPVSALTDPDTARPLRSEPVNVASRPKAGQ